MPERRKHRSPLTTQGPFLLGNTGVHVAHCATPEVARFLKVTANAFDALTEALDLCRGELELDDSFLTHPGYVRLKVLREQVERELRG